MNVSISGWQEFFRLSCLRVHHSQPFQLSGTLAELTDQVLDVRGISLGIGSQCLLSRSGQRSVLAEVAGFSKDHTFLIPAGQITGLTHGASVLALEAAIEPLSVHQSEINPVQSNAGVLLLPMGKGLFGRVIDAQGLCLDDKGPLTEVSLCPIARAVINSMERSPIRDALDCGVAAINGLFTLGRGQRLGLMAGSGVGKSVLLGMLARFTQAEVIVVGLIGERGREVKEFIEDILGPSGLSRSVVVAAPADAPPLLRMQGAEYATAVAEYFRNQGSQVLLLMDSLTRYAMAQREIALALGEAPATKAYPPSCFSKLSQLVERSGNGLRGHGSITAIYTVLSEGDDQQDPIADAARAILDGHIVLSRQLAEAGHYPAIDLEQSISRVMHNLVPAEHFEMARRFRALSSRHARAHDLIQIGAYVKGADPELDEAIRLNPSMLQFLQQDMGQSVSLPDSRDGMQQALSRSPSTRDLN